MMIIKLRNTKGFFKSHNTTIARKENFMFFQGGGILLWRLIISMWILLLLLVVVVVVVWFLLHKNRGGMSGGGGDRILLLLIPSTPSSISSVYYTFTSFLSSSSSSSTTNMTVIMSYSMYVYYSKTHYFHHHHFEQEQQQGSFFFVNSFTPPIHYYHHHHHSRVIQKRWQQQQQQHISDVLLIGQRQQRLQKDSLEMMSPHNNNNKNNNNYKNRINDSNTLSRTTKMSTTRKMSRNICSSQSWSNIMTLNQYNQNKDDDMTMNNDKNQKKNLFTSSTASSSSSYSIEMSNNNNKKKIHKSKKKKQRPMPIVGYNIHEIQQHYNRLPWIVLWRLLHSLVLPLMSWYIRLWLDNHHHHYINHKNKKEEEEEKIQKQRGKELRDILIHSQSVAFIKSGQALSLRPDLIQNIYYAQELSKLVDAVDCFDDVVAMKILIQEWKNILSLVVVPPSLSSSHLTPTTTLLTNKKKFNRIQKMIDTTFPILTSLLQFHNENYAIASASIGQVYKATFTTDISLLTFFLGSQKEATFWKGKTIAIKIQRPNIIESASLDMYLLHQAATFMSTFRGGNLMGIVDTFGLQLFGELDYIREANNMQRFYDLYHDNIQIVVPQPCLPLTTKKILVMEWIDGTKGPWNGQVGLDIVQLGLKCSVDQLLNTGLFHADPHRGNLLRTPDGKLAFIDFGMMADVTEEERYGLIGLAIGLQNKDLSLVTENLLKLGFLDNTSQLDVLVPRLRQAFINSTGGTGKSSDVNFSRLQGELDAISRENNITFKTPPFFTVIIRSLTILEGFALSVDPNFRLVRGAYPYVLAQLVSSQDGSDNENDNDGPPQALQNLLMRLLTVNGEGKEIEWERLRDFLILARKAQQKYEPQTPSSSTSITASKAKPLSIQDRSALSRQTMDLLFRFLTSKTGLFLKKPLVHELAEIIDGMASIGESNLLDWSRGLLQPLPGGAGPINPRRMEELSKLLDTIQDALALDSNKKNQNSKESLSSSSTRSNLQRLQYVSEIVQEISVLLTDLRKRDNAMPLLGEIFNVIQLVAVEVLEIRASRAVRRLLQLNESPGRK